MICASKKSLICRVNNNCHVKQLAKKPSWIKHYISALRKMQFLCIKLYFLSILWAWECLNPLTTNVRHHTETSQLICILNELTGFCMMQNIGSSRVNIPCLQFIQSWHFCIEGADKVININSFIAYLLVLIFWWPQETRIKQKW